MLIQNGCSVGVPSVGAGAFDRRKHPAVAGVPVGAGVPGRRGGGCWCSCRGLFAFLPIICGLHVAVFGVSS